MKVPAELPMTLAASIWIAERLESCTANTIFHSIAERLAIHTTNAETRNYEQRTKKIEAINELCSIAERRPAEYVPQTEPLKAQKGESYGIHDRFCNGLKKSISDYVVSGIHILVVFIGIVIFVLIEGLANKLAMFFIAAAACEKYLKSVVNQDGSTEDGVEVSRREASQPAYIYWTI